MIQGIGSILVGVYFLSVGLGKVRVSKNPEANETFLKKWRTFFLIAGPIAAVSGLAMLLTAF